MHLHDTRRHVRTMLTCTVLVVLAACSPAGGGAAAGGGPQPAATAEGGAAADSEAPAVRPDRGAAPSEQLGPRGEQPVRHDAVRLSPQEMDAVRELAADVAFVWHGSDSFTEALMRGAEERFGEMGVDIVAVTDAGYDPSKQRSDLETVVALQPDVIVSTPVDATSSAAAYRAALDAGVEFVFIEQPPRGFRHGQDHIGIVGADFVTAARHSAELIGEAMGGTGKLGFFFFDANFFATNQWDAAFRDVIVESYPDIELISAGYADPARADQTASAVFTQHPDLAGVYATWQDPLEGVLAALRQSGLDQSLPATTVGLNENIALAMAQEQNVVGVGIDAPFAQGHLVADVAALGLLDRPAPEFAIVDASRVTRDNLAESWQQAYGIPLPASVRKVLDGT